MRGALGWESARDRRVWLLVPPRLHRCMAPRCGGWHVRRVQRNVESCSPDSHRRVIVGPGGYDSINSLNYI